MNSRLLLIVGIAMVAVMLLVLGAGIMAARRSNAMTKVVSSESNSAAPLR